MFVLWQRNVYIYALLNNFVINMGQVIMSQEKKTTRYGNSLVIVLGKGEQQFLEVDDGTPIVVECSLSKSKKKYFAIYKKGD